MATKKNSKRNSSKKNVARRPRAAASYELTAKGASELLKEEHSGQPKLIASALKNGQPITARDLAAKVAGKLETKQEPMRVVGFYLSMWKGDGFVKSIAAKKQAAAAA